MPETPPALIAFGSRDATMFQDGLGTENIQFLAGVIERLMRRHLTL